MANVARFLHTICVDVKKYFLYGFLPPKASRMCVNLFRRASENKEKEVLRGE
jgi:hypothetical protein